jgi:propionyl-CoA carboxylase alpha chain
VRLDSAVEDGSVISPHYDPMLAKVISWAPTRAEAARLLASTLVRSRLHGVVTNRDLLVRILRDQEFLSGGTDTAYLQRHPEVFLPLVSTVDDRWSVCLAAALAGSVDPTAPWHALPSGWRNVASAPQCVVFGTPWADRVEVTYRLDRDGALHEWSVDGQPGPSLRLLRRAADEVILEGATRRTFAVHRTAGISYVDCEAGAVALVEAPRFPSPTVEYAEGSLFAPMPGTVGRVAVTAGSAVAAGDLLLTLEAMKMEHAIRAPETGTVTELLVEPGQQVEPGTPLAIVTADEPAGP